MAHPVVKLGVDVQVGLPEDLWVLGQSRLGEKTRLGAESPPYTWVELDCDLVEVTWSQGTGTAEPDRVVPRPAAGTATITLVDADHSWLPGADPAVGIRPSRAVRIMDRGPKRLLWLGVVERTSFTMDPAAPLHTVTVDCVDHVTLLQRAPEVRTARPVESVAARVAWLVDTHRPGHPVMVAPGATQNVAAIAEGDRLTLWSALVDAADAESGWLWVRRDGTVSIGDVGTVGVPPKVWAPGPCSPVALESAGQDLMTQPTRWDVTRRSSGQTDVPVPQTATNTAAVSVYGDWQSTVENLPAATDPQALTAATLAAAWWSPPRMQLGAVRVNVTVAAGTPDLSLMLGLYRDLQLGDALNLSSLAPPAVPSVAVLVIGWQWTWTAAGALTGTLTVTATPVWSGDGGHWILGSSGHTELDTTARLAPAA